MLDRRRFLSGLGASFALAACTPTRPSLDQLGIRPHYLVAPAGEPFPVAPVNLNRVPAQFHRQVVPNTTGERPGTVVVDPNARFLYLVQEDDTAMRYGIGVGREGFRWSGAATIRRKAKWPTWTPPKNMQERQPETRKWAAGMPGGPANPLGARALYLYRNGKDTLYRIHGTNEPSSIGRAVSSGCIRLFNADIIDLYDRVPTGTRVVVRPSRAPAMV
jgi:lipoprotein-anchoring transpeptidase ErfK/SrfK